MNVFLIALGAAVVAAPLAGIIAHAVLDAMWAAKHIAL